MAILPAILLTVASCSGNNRIKDGSVIPLDALERLNDAIDKAETFTRLRFAAIDSLKSYCDTIREIPLRREMLLDISAAYRQVDTDSAIRYANLAMETIVKDLPESDRIKSLFTFANAMSTAGLFPEAIHILDSLNGRLTDIQTKVEYWKSCRILYSYMLAFVRTNDTQYEHYRKRYIECDDSLLVNLPAGDPFRSFIHSERLVSDGRLDEAQRNLQILMKTHPISSNIYGMAAYQLAEVFKDKGDGRKYAEMLALAAESDIRGCVREGVALPALANWLYLQGDVDNAFNYINFALEEANSGNIRMRTVTIMPLMPIIDRTYRQKIDSSRNQIIGYLIVTLILFLTAATLSAWLIRSLRRNRANERRLAESSKTLREYVGNFIGLCSNYAIKLDQFAKLVNRKISSGQIDDLKKILNSGKFDEGDDEDFYQLIDKAILDIFPDFVKDINSLLVPEKRIELKPGEALNPELRIYAFIRLGVDQSSRIAQILHYSVNTVYTYRNRMRNRAIDRDSFDADVMNIENGHGNLNSLISD